MIGERAADHGRGLYIRNFGPRRLGDRRSHHRLHHLAQPEIPSPGRPDRARPRPPRGPDPGFHCRGVQNLWRRDRQQRAEDAGARRSLCHGQPYASAVDAAIGRLRGHRHAHNHQDLFRAESDDQRSARRREERQGHRPLEGIQRSGARGAASVRVDVVRSLNTLSSVSASLPIGGFELRLPGPAPNLKGNSAAQYF